MQENGAGNKFPEHFKSINRVPKHTASHQTYHRDLEVSGCVLHISDLLYIFFLAKKQPDYAGMRKAKQLLILHLDTQ